MSILLGCIADDFTGATDLANTLVKEGMRTTQVIGIPDGDFDPTGNDAIVVALKCRTIPADEAVAQAMQALAWLQHLGAQQFFWKYCSTFDSTDDGNIGPVGDALLDMLDAPFTVACPAFPTAGRTIFNGHLFVGDMLLSESGMKDHPLTPMRDANLVRVLGRQTPYKVGLVAYNSVRDGPAVVRRSFDAQIADGCRYAITDAISDDHLRTIGAACAEMKLITGGSGIALGLPGNFRNVGKLATQSAPVLPNVDGRQAILSGSCSVATRGQVHHWCEKRPAFRIDPFKLAEGNGLMEEAVTWFDALAPDATPLFYSSDNPEAVASIQNQLGRDAAGALVETFMGQLAKHLVERGVHRLIVAGGETSGAVVQALGVTALTIGPEIDPGVPWTTTHGAHTITLALKSGNFGTVDFFTKAFGMLA